MEDQHLMVDLRELNSDKFAVFWEKMKVYLNESSAVHERRHGEVMYMAKAVSVQDLIQEVAKNVSWQTCAIRAVGASPVLSPKSAC